MRSHGDNLPVIQYWHSGSPPGDVAELVESFRQQNSAREHLLFSRSSAESFIEAHFSLRELTAFRSCAIPAMQSDYFRYCAVLALGGIYADADIRCHASLDTYLVESEGADLFAFMRGLEFAGGSHAHVYNGFFSFDAPGHPLLECVLDVATANIEARDPGEVWLATGPGLFSLFHLLQSCGSATAFTDLIASLRNETLSRLAGRVRASARRHGGARRAFDGVRILPKSRLERWLAEPDRPLAYRTTDLDWRRAKAGIYRDERAPL